MQRDGGHRQGKQEDQKAGSDSEEGAERKMNGEREKIDGDESCMEMVRQKEVKMRTKR